ncbi:hypothetical protein ASF08_07875 [Methylobacterium sp. Leaf85]|nr:hypothetical protein ASF08_07875 [Methylobacterium sp. Leaf85]
MRAARIAWPLIDQGVASLGNFLFTIALARTLPPQEYGAFALLFGILMILYTVMASVLFYPMSVLADPADRGRIGELMSVSFILLVGLCVPAGLVLAVTAFLIGRPDLIAALLVYFFVWQVQEAFRRYLFVELRFGAAVPGEIVSYMGQILIALWLALRGDLTLETALYAMTVTSAAAAVLQGIQVGFSLRRHAMTRIRAVALEFWRLGGWALANNLCAALRVQFLFWFLAALSGAALPALLQAGFNIVNLLNPLMIGLGNVILQVSSRAHAGGKAEAWRATHPLALSGMPIVIVFLAAIVAFPHEVLGLIYGAHSPYVDIATPVRLLAIAALAAFVTDIVCAYFHGVSQAKQALIVNAAGAVATIPIAIPLIIGFGLNGACIALCLANAVRLVVLHLLFTRMIATDTADASSGRVRDQAVPARSADDPGEAMPAPEPIPVGDDRDTGDFSRATALGR